MSGRELTAAEQAELDALIVAQTKDDTYYIPQRTVPFQEERGVPGRVRALRGDVPHGSRSGYGWFYRCRCQHCRAHHAAEQLRLRKSGRLVPDRVHGTVNGYTNYDCRCLECRHAWRLYKRERRAAA